MKKIKKTLLVIPARGGSKRIKKKNIKNICGKPMLAWTLNQLNKFISKQYILVSTDDKEVLKLAKSFGLNVSYKRPKNLAGDHISTLEVIKHALNWYEKKYGKTTYTLIVYPTAIFIDTKDIYRAYNLILSKPSSSIVFSASLYSHPIERALRKGKNNITELIFPEHSETRTQDLKPSYYDAGQFYLCKSSFIREAKSILKCNSKFVVIPKSKAIDIDTSDDFILAESLLKRKINYEKKN